MWQYNGITVRVGRSWTDDNGVMHPSVWTRWSDEFKKEMGLTWQEPVVPEPYDERFYYSANNPKNLEDIQVVDTDGNPVLDIDGNQMITSGLKNTWIARTKNHAYGMLKSTDWYAIRQVETSQAIPENLLNYRASVRSSCDSICSAITGCTTLEEFIALFTVPTDADGRPNGKAPIDNFPEA